ncbi:hypothetical protein M1D79_11310 [Enterobacter sp. SA24]
MPLLRRVDFGLQQMDLRTREVGKPTRMIEIKMRKNDVPDIRSAESQRFNARNAPSRFPVAEYYSSPEKSLVKFYLAGECHFARTRYRPGPARPAPFR